MMKENFWKRGGRRFVLIFAVLLFCGGLAFLLSELLPKYAPPDETEPTVKVLPEGKDYWITEIEGEVTLMDGVMTLKFGNHTIDISNLEWYRILDKLRGEVITTHYRVDVVKGNEAVCEAGFPWSEDLLLSAVLNVGGRPGVIACERGGQACPGATAAERETYLFDLEAGKWDPFERIGIELYYWVAEEYRLYSVRTLVTKEEFNIIKQNIVSEFERNYTGSEDRQISVRLWYFNFIDFIQPRNYVYEGHEHCAYDNYAWDFLPQDLGKW